MEIGIKAGATRPYNEKRGNFKLRLSLPMALAVAAGLGVVADAGAFASAEALSFDQGAEVVIMGTGRAVEVFLLFP